MVPDSSSGVNSPSAGLALAQLDQGLLTKSHGIAMIQRLIMMGEARLAPKLPHDGNAMK